MPPLQRLPAHCRVAARPAGRVVALRALLRRRGLHSVCEEARCPNLPRCFDRGTVTFMLLGDVCTRACGFCNVATGRPAAGVDPGEPTRVAAAVCELGLRHVVLTSVNRDDLPDQGAGQFAQTVARIREAGTGATVEVLTPDFRGEPACIDRVADSRPEVYNHNVETVPRLYRHVRAGARYGRSLRLLARVKERRPELLTKSGLMVGLGETMDEVCEVLGDLRTHGVEAVTIGQYLRPTLRHLPVARYLDLEEFAALGRRAEALGFRHVASGPLVRSSFGADDALRVLAAGRADA